MKWIDDPGIFAAKSCQNCKHSKFDFDTKKRYCKKRKCDVTSKNCDIVCADWRGM